MTAKERIKAKEMLTAVKTMDEVKQAYVKGIVDGLKAQTMSQAKEADPR